MPPRSLPDPARPYFTPSTRVSGDWSAHIATTLDRTATLLSGLSPEQWEAPSMCDGWRVRDVAGHIVWRLGTSTGGLMRETARGALTHRFDYNRIAFDAAIAEAKASPEQLVERIQRIANEKVQGKGRDGIGELTEAVVHAYDISEALGIPIRLSPRSTAAVALVRARMPVGRGRMLAREFTLRAVDARWQIGEGPVLEATAAQLVLHLFGRKGLSLASVERHPAPDA